MGISIGPLIHAAVNAAGGGLRGQNKGDDVNFERRRQLRQDARADALAELSMYVKQLEGERAQAMTGYYNRGRQTQTPWERDGFADREDWLRFKAQEAEATARDRARNIDPLSPEGIAAAEARERRLSRIPRRPSAGGDGGDDGDVSLGPLERTIDDLDREAARAEREVPPAWTPFMAAVHPDSAAYEDSVRGPAMQRADSLRRRRDRFGDVREQRVGQMFGIDQPSPAPATPGGPAAPPVGAPVPAGAPTTGRDPRIADLERQYAEALAWRGPNGERKDPEWIRQRFQEALAEILRAPPQ